MSLFSFILISLLTFAVKDMKVFILLTEFKQTLLTIKSLNRVINIKNTEPSTVAVFF